MLTEMITAIILLAAIGLIAGVLLSVASKFMFVESNEQLEAVSGALPGINCGACGFAGCDDYAKAIVKESAKTNLCIPGGDKASKDISVIMGTEFEDVKEEVATVRCLGSEEVTKALFDYDGIKTCAGVSMFYHGKWACKYGCLAYGDCVKVCRYDAIKVKNGVAEVDPSKCVGCKMCVERCPQQIIKTSPEEKPVFVACTNNSKGKETRAICQKGCIGCKKCAKLCPAGAITVEHDLATIDSELCTSCGLCVKECPTGSIKNSIKPANLV